MAKQPNHGRRKRGRPRKPYKASWGEHINGLRRRSDGRWVIVETGQTFVEPDERRAVTRFRRWEAEQQHETVVELSMPLSAFESPAGVDAAVEAGASLQGMRDGSYAIGVEFYEPAVWNWVREQLIARPEYVAEQTGIPEVARLAALPQPEPSPTLKEVGQLYQDKAKVQHKQRRQMQLFWEHFRDWLAPARALASHPDEQPAGAGEPGGASSDAGGGRVPGWPLGADAGRGTAASHRWHALGHAALPGHESAARVGAVNGRGVISYRAAHPVGWAVQAGLTRGLPST